MVMMYGDLKIAVWLHLRSMEVKSGQDTSRAKGAAVPTLVSERGVWTRGERTRRVLETGGT